MPLYSAILVLLVVLAGCDQPVVPNPNAPVDATSLIEPPHVFFDDFSYSNADELANSTDQVDGNPLNWIIVDGINGPPRNARYSKNQVQFTDDPNGSCSPGISVNCFLVLKATTKNTSQSMLLSRIETQFRFLHGTYGARVLFTNDPQTQYPGDASVQTFYTIRTTSGESYAELDFEYLPYDIWDNVPGVNNLWMVTWDRTDLQGSIPTTDFPGSCPDTSIPTDPTDYLYVNENRRARTNHCNWSGAWHTLVVQANPGTEVIGDGDEVVDYYVDGALRESAGNKPYPLDDSDDPLDPPIDSYYPTHPMNISLAHWIAERNRSRTVRTYSMLVDWVLYVEGEVKNSQEMQAIVDEYRSHGKARRDTSSCQSRSDTTTFPCSDGDGAAASLNTDALVTDASEWPTVVDNEVGPPPQIGLPMK